MTVVATLAAGKVWNEPNARTNLRTQIVGRRWVSPAHYRRMIEAVARGVRRVDPSNVIVAGALSPFGHNSRDIQVIAPLRFMRSLLCVSNKLRPTCSDGATFDVWAHHPYTNGGPRLSARAADNASIGDLDDMRRVLDAAIAVGNVRARRDVQFWVTEFSWDTKPGDPAAVPAANGAASRTLDRAQRGVAPVRVERRERSAILRLRLWRARQMPRQHVVGVAGVPSSRAVRRPRACLAVPPAALRGVRFAISPC